MNKSQQFILSEHLEEIKEASKFTSFLATKRVNTLTIEEIAELFAPLTRISIYVSPIFNPKGQAISRSPFITLSVIITSFFPFFPVLITNL